MQWPTWSMSHTINQTWWSIRRNVQNVFVSELRCCVRFVERVEIRNNNHKFISCQFNYICAMQHDTYMNWNSVLLTLISTNTRSIIFQINDAKSSVCRTLKAKQMSADIYDTHISNDITAKLQFAELNTHTLLLHNLCLPVDQLTVDRNLNSATVSGLLRESFDKKNKQNPRHLTTANRNHSRNDHHLVDITDRIGSNTIYSPSEM